MTDHPTPAIIDADAPVTLLHGLVAELWDRGSPFSIAPRPPGPAAAEPHATPTLSLAR